MLACPLVCFGFCPRCSRKDPLLGRCREINGVKSVLTGGSVAVNCALARTMLEEHDGLWELAELRPFLNAVRDGNDLAAA